jgi:hypothetical protein
MRISLSSDAVDWHYMRWSFMWTEHLLDKYWRHPVKYGWAFVQVGYKLKRIDGLPTSIFLRLQYSATPEIEAEKTLKRKGL